MVGWSSLEEQGVSTEPLHRLVQQVLPAVAGGVFAHDTHMLYDGLEAASLTDSICMLSILSGKCHTRLVLKNKQPLASA